MDTILIKREVTVFQKMRPTAFNKQNNEIFGAQDKPIGPSARAEKLILSNGELLASLLPTVLGLSERATEFTERASRYFHNFQMYIPVIGKTLDTSLIVDFESNKLTSEINKLKAEAKAKNNYDIVDTNTLTKYIEAKVEEERKFKYATPTNNADYLAYLYLREHNRVARNAEIADNIQATNIEFYMTSQVDIEKAMEKAYKLRTTVRKYLALCEDKEELANNIFEYLKIYESDRYVRYTKLETYTTTNAEQFISLVEDKNLKIKATLQSLVTAGLILNPTHSGLYIDADDPALVLGASIDEAVSYVNSASNQAWYTSKISQLKSLKK